MILKKELKSNWKWDESTALKKMGQEYLELEAYGGHQLSLIISLSLSLSLFLYLSLCLSLSVSLSLSLFLSPLALLSLGGH